ncbi:hypothetical protein BDN72DRAFT_905604 [Pluteus cervinus]|uniref:Uncharacterized protein n=1 Tax=Pluteus cervinus TaxID=181527 RepID=A0ACD3A2A2_9AGAR|nr:hypothetical protein BDN72DRAFT_905604 [Pluteus cervinus]
MNPGIWETIINSKSQLPGVTPHCIFFKVEHCVVGEGTAAERTYIPGQFVLVREPPCDSCQKAQIVSIIIDVASLQTFVVVAWLFESGDLGSIKCLDGPVAHWYLVSPMLLGTGLINMFSKELQDLLGPRELLRSNAIDYHVHVEKYQDQMLDYPLTLLNGNVWHYRMELHFTNHQHSSAQLREYNLTCTEECAAIYSPNSGLWFTIALPSSELGWLSINAARSWLRPEVNL